jgi:hypothetical protein
MKARIPKNEYDPNTIGVPKKLIEDKQYAKEFWEYLIQSNPEGDYGEFEGWYNKLCVLDFKQKLHNTPLPNSNRASRRAKKAEMRKVKKTEKGGG